MGEFTSSLAWTRLLFVERFLIMDSVTFTDLEGLFYIFMTILVSCAFQEISPFHLCSKCFGIKLSIMSWSF